MEIKQKKRSEIPSEYKWNLENLIPSPEDWRKRVAAMPAKIKKLKSFEGNLNDAETLLAYLELAFATEDELDRLYVYAGMKLHEDANNSKAQAMESRAENTNTKFYTAIAFADPEILALGKSAIQKFYKAAPGLKKYRFYLDNLLRTKAHVRSAEVEAILEAAEEFGSAAESIYEMLGNADLKFDSITDADGNQVEVTHSKFDALMQSPDRRVRHDAFNAYYDGYWKLKNTVATIYSSSVKKDVFFANTRKYKSALDEALFEDNIPRVVYDNLIKTVHEFLPVMHRYMRLRKKVLGVDELQVYDIRAPLVEDVEMKIPYEEAKTKLMEGLAPMGEKYLSDMKKGMESGWVDVYANEGKQSGAYQWGTYGGHPYVLLNHEDTLDDTLTLAHEMGHAMHSYYSWETQPYVYSDCTTFLAEVASTVNEVLMTEHLLENTSDPKAKAFLVNKYLDNFKGTIFRQVMFAEFEAAVHDLAEDDEPLTLEVMNELYRGLLEKYHGEDVVLDSKIDLEWALIPHFYSAFYVYQYATGLSAAMAFVQRIKNEGQPALEDYLTFLKSGGSDYSIDILKKAGVDMSSPTPIQEALKVFEKLVGELEKLIG